MQRRSASPPRAYRRGGLTHAAREAGRRHLDHRALAPHRLMRHAKLLRESPQRDRDLGKLARRLEGMWRSRSLSTPDSATLTRLRPLPQKPMASPNRSLRVLEPASNRSVAIVEPVSGCRKRKLEKYDQRLSPKMRRFGARSRPFTQQRHDAIFLLRNASLQALIEPLRRDPGVARVELSGIYFASSYEFARPSQPNVEGLVKRAGVRGQRMHCGKCMCDRPTTGRQLSGLVNTAD
jgi:hypothetical protein